MLVDPIGYHEDRTTLSQGIVNGVQHPAEFGKALIDYDTWKQSPGRALGHLVPDALAAAATAGAGAAATRGARGLKTVDDVADGVQTADRASDAATDLRRVAESAVTRSADTRGQAGQPVQRGIQPSTGRRRHYGRRGSS
jgi:hypothetical protein